MQSASVWNGARGLSSIVEEFLIDVMYELPSMKGVKQCIVVGETVSGQQWPKILDESGKRMDTKLPPHRQTAA